MDFRLTPEQELLRDSARRYFAAAGRFETRRRSVSAADVEWASFAELGWLAMLVPEAQDGLGSPLEDIAIVCEEMGRGLALSAFIGGAVLPARVLARCEVGARQAMWLASLAQGAARWAVAIHEPERRYQLVPQLRASATADGGWRLTGDKSLVLGGARADQLIVSAMIEATADTRARPALFVVDAGARGLHRRIYPLVDDVEAADLHFDDVAIAADARLATSAPALEALQAALDEALVCLCAETLGGVDRAIEMTADYLKMRKQFGQPLAEFQVLQHAVAEMWIDASGARSALYRAIAALGADPAARGQAVAACFIKQMQVAKTVSGTAIHLHGGIGLSCEYPVGHYLRRVLVSERTLTDRESALARYME